jgi:hypothetical protein
LKWTLAVLAVIGGFLVAGIAGGLMAEILGFWDLPGAGFCAAFAVVVVAYLAAPSHKFSFAIAALAVGAVAAWLILIPSYYPESYGDRGAYQPTSLPIILTYAGGIVGLVVAGVLKRWAGPNNSFKPMPLRGTA